METDYWNCVHPTRKTQTAKEPVKKSRVRVLLSCDEEGIQTPLYIKLYCGNKIKIDEIIGKYTIYSRRTRYTVKLRGKTINLYNDDKIWAIDTNVFEELKG